MPPVLNQNTEREEEGEGTAADARCYLEAFYRQVPSRVRDFIASTATSTVNDNIPERMKAFRKVEVAESGDNPNYLVSPSGSSKAPLGLLLHYPTFKIGKSDPVNGETADGGNCCIRLLLRKGFHQVNCLFLDLYARRANMIPIAERKFLKKRQ